MTTDLPGTITIPLCANHIASAVSELPEYIGNNRNISAVEQDGARQGGPESGIHLEDGSIWTGFYPNWDTLSRDEVDEVMDERDRKRSDRRKKSGGGNSRRKRNGDGGDGKKEEVYKTELNQLKSALKKRNRKIAALTKGKSDGSDSGNSDDGSSSGDDAGNQFGGKRQKKSNKGSK